MMLIGMGRISIIRNRVNNTLHHKRTRLWKTA